MVSLKDIENVLVAMVPLYVAMFLGYISMKWWKIFTPDQCSGINKFVAKISVPFLSFHVISSSNPYKMNSKLILADTFQKVIALSMFAIFDICILGGRLDWLITGFSLSTLPNTLIVGVPLVNGMYGEEAAKIMGQIIVLQVIIWYTLLLFLFEFRAAKAVVGGLPNEITGQESQEEQEFRGTGDSVNAINPRKKKTWLVLLTVWKKLMTNPNTYTSLAGLGWALISFRWGFHLPVIVNNSISIMSDGGLGMAMFSLGLFMASQSKFIACGTRMAALAMVLRFFLGPGIMTISSYALGMRGKLFSVAIVQAACPLAIVPFVFAKEYELHPDILSTGNIIGLILAVPIALAYYFLLGL